MAGCRDVFGKDGRHQHLDVGELNSVQCENVVNETTDEEKLKRRLNTYTQWTSKKSSLQLATAGFIYTGIADKVECQSCGIRLYNWQEDEEPLLAHKKYAPDCEFMMTNFPEIKAPPKPKKILTVKYKHYADYEARLRSFDSWPLKCAAQKPEMMARSGFFYIGSADRARCFHCGVTLRDWDTDDYPPCAHRQWSEHCPFVQQLDIDFIEAVIKRWEGAEKLRIYFEHLSVTGQGDLAGPDSFINRPAVQTMENEQSTFFNVRYIQRKVEPGESMVVEENNNHVLGDHAPSDHVPGDHVLGDHVPGDHVLGDNVPGDHVLDEGASAWARSNSNTLDADLQAACEIFLHGKCNGTAEEHGRDAASEYKLDLLLRDQQH